MLHHDCGAVLFLMRNKFARKRIFCGLVFLWVMLPSCVIAASDEGSLFVPVGTTEDVQYARELWDSMVQNRLEGEGRKTSPPFFGGAKPHGEILELLYQYLTVASHAGYIVVKRNYDKQGATVERVAEDRKRYLSSITVMYQREAGYDEANQN